VESNPGPLGLGKLLELLDKELTSKIAKKYAALFEKLPEEIKTTTSLLKYLKENPVHGIPEEVIKIIERLHRESEEAPPPTALLEELLKNKTLQSYAIPPFDLGRFVQRKEVSELNQKLISQIKSSVIDKRVLNYFIIEGMSGIGKTTAGQHIVMNMNKKFGDGVIYNYSQFNTSMESNDENQGIGYLFLSDLLLRQSYGVQKNATY